MCAKNISAKRKFDKFFAECKKSCVSGCLASPGCDDRINERGDTCLSITEQKGLTDFRMMHYQDKPMTTEQKQVLWSSLHYVFDRLVRITDPNRGDGELDVTKLDPSTPKVNTLDKRSSTELKERERYLTEKAKGMIPLRRFRSNEGRSFAVISQMGYIRTADIVFQLPMDLEDGIITEEIEGVVMNALAEINGIIEEAFRSKRDDERNGKL